MLCQLSYPGPEPIINEPWPDRISRSYNKLMPHPPYPPDNSQRVNLFDEGVFDCLSPEVVIIKVETSVIDPDSRTETSIATF